MVVRTRPTYPQAVAAGRAVQDAAHAALTGGPRCPHERTIGRYRWACISPPHASGREDVDGVRRRRGESVHADRHVMVVVGEVR